MVANNSKPASASQKQQALNLSGIVVATRAEHLDQVLGDLAKLPGVDIFQVDRESSRIVIVQDLETTDEQIEGLRQIQALKDVTYAELVYHYFGED